MQTQWHQPQFFQLCKVNRRRISMQVIDLPVGRSSSNASAPIFIAAKLTLGFSTLVHSFLKFRTHHWQTTKYELKL